MKKIIVFNVTIVIVAIALAVIATIRVFAGDTTPPPDVSTSAIQRIPTFSMVAGFFSAALAVGLSCFAAGMAVKSVGAAAMGAIAEKPELTGRALIFVGLAEGIAIYGLIVAIMILGKLV